MCACIRLCFGQACACRMQVRRWSDRWGPSDWPRRGRATVSTPIATIRRQRCRATPETKPLSVTCLSYPVHWQTFLFTYVDERYRRWSGPDLSVNQSLSCENRLFREQEMHVLYNTCAPEHWIETWQNGTLCDSHRRENTSIQRVASKCWNFENICQSELIR